LSYAWDEPDELLPKRFIVCSHNAAEVTPNLFAALQRLRYPDQSRALWIDALCINQRDEEERGSQVRIMRDIYANARRVLVWLGEESEMDRLAFDSLEWIQSQLDEYNNSVSLTGLGWYRTEDGRIVSGGTEKRLLTDPRFLHLFALLHRTWFRRTWVVQEVASARSTLMFCGSKSVTWGTFARTIKKLQDNP